MSVQVYENKDTSRNFCLNIQSNLRLVRFAGSDYLLINQSGDSMDIMHHTAIGFAGAMALTALGHPLASAAFLTASILPDADVAYMLKSKRAYLKAHQSVTHSIPVGAAVGVLMGTLATHQFGIAQGAAVSAAFFASFVIHVLLDASNTLGTWLLWPFGRRLRLDAVFFIDAISWALTASTLLALWCTGQAWPFAAYIAAMAGQILLRAGLASRARSASCYPIAIPDPLIPWRYSLTRIEQDGSASFATWSALSGISNEGHTAAPSPEALKLAAQSIAVADMSAFARALVVVEERREDGLLKVVMRDIAMRRMGGRYGEVTLSKSEDGEINEQINI